MCMSVSRDHSYSNLVMSMVNWIYTPPTLTFNGLASPGERLSSRASWGTQYLGWSGMIRGLDGMGFPPRFSWRAKNWPWAYFSCIFHAKSLTTIRLSEWHSHNVFSTRIQNYPFDRVIHGLHHSCSRAVCWMNLGASEQNAKYGKNKRVYKHSVYIIHYNTLLSVNLHNSTCQKATIHALSPRTMKDEKSVILQPIKQCDVWTKIGLYIALLTI